MPNLPTLAKLTTLLLAVTATLSALPAHAQTNTEPAPIVRAAPQNTQPDYRDNDQTGPMQYPAYAGNAPVVEEYTYPAIYPYPYAYRYPVLGFGFGYGYPGYYRGYGFRGGYGYGGYGYRGGYGRGFSGGPRGGFGGGGFRGGGRR